MRWILSNIFIFIPLIILVQVIFADAYLVDKVFGYKNFTLHDKIYYEGDKINIYIDVNDVSHEGYTAVDIIIHVIDDFTKDVVYIDRVNARFKNYTDEFFIVYKLDSSKLKPGRYILKILVYDRAFGLDKVIKELKSAALDPSSPRYNDYKKFLKAPQGINVNDNIYSDLKLLQPYDKSLLKMERILHFEILPKKVLKKKIYKEIRIEINNTYYTDDFIRIKYNLEPLIHDGTLIVDIYTLLYDENGIPQRLKVDRLRFVNVTEKTFTQKIDTTDLPKGKYYLKIKVFDRYAKSLKDVYEEILKTFPREIDKIKYLKNIREGINIDDGAYKTLGMILPLKNSKLVYDIVHEITLIEKPVEKRIGPRIVVHKIETDKIEYDVTDKMLVKVYVSNIGGKGNITLHLRIEGKRFGISLPKKVYMLPKRNYTISFIVLLSQLNLKEGFYRVGLEESNVFTLIRIINKTAVVKSIEERLKPKVMKEEIKSKTLIYYLSGFLAGSVILRLVFGRNNSIYKKYLNYFIILFALLFISYILIYIS